MTDYISDSLLNRLAAELRAIADNTVNDQLSDALFAVADDRDTLAQFAQLLSNHADKESALVELTTKRPTHANANA